MYAAPVAAEDAASKVVLKASGDLPGDGVIERVCRHYIILYNDVIYHIIC